MQDNRPSQGLEAFKDQISKIADLGRYEDTYIVHAAEGETVVPMEVLDENPQLKALLFNQMLDMGINPHRYIVGNEFNSINPITGQPEFFLKKLFKSAKKALKKVAPYAGMIAGAMGMGPGYSALIGAAAPALAGQGAGASLAGGLGGYGVGSALGSSKFAQGLGAKPNQGMFYGKPNTAPTSNSYAGPQDFINNKPNPVKQDKNFFQKMFTGKEEKFKTAYDKYKTQYPPEVAMQLAEKASTFELPGGALTATLAPMALGAIGQYFDKKNEKPSAIGADFYEVNPKSTWMGQFGNVDRTMGKADGGIMGMQDEIMYENSYNMGGLNSLGDFQRMNGQIEGPGGPKDDLVPAMLSDGEFVMTAKAVENAGGPQAMYNLMNNLDPESSRGVM